LISVGHVRQVIVLLLVPITAAALSACGGHKNAGVFAVERGMTKQQVQKRAGHPYHAGPSCWLYRGIKKGTSIDAMRFCFTNGRVSLIQTGMHG
jgi:hypothetical protein